MVMRVGDDVTVNGKIVAGLNGRTILIQLESGAYALIHDEDVNTISVENKCFDRMTNGDVIEVIFRDHSHMHYDSNGEYIYVWSNDGKYQMTIHKDFWNAPYQKGGEDKNDKT